MDASEEPNGQKDANGNGLPGLYRRYFAQRVVYAEELPSIMRRHIYTGAMGNVWGFLISGVFFVNFGNAIGLSPADWGLLSGLSSFLLSAELISARLTRQVGQRKLLWFWFAVVSRTIRLVGIILSYWLWLAGYTHAGFILIAAICLSNFFGAMGNPPWMSWLADIIPTAKHGRFWARRTWWINVSVIFAVLPAAWLIDWVDEPLKLKIAVIVFIVATAIGLLDLILHGTIPEPAMVVPKEEDFVKQFLEPIRDRGYRRWLVFIGCWTFGMTFGGALCMVYFVGDLGLKDNMIAAAVALIVLNQLGVLLGSRKWGLYVDRYGVKPVLFWGHIGWSFLPFFWLFATKDTVIWFVGIASFLGGSASNAAVIAANKLITRYPPPGHHVATYTAVSSSVSNWASGVACLAAGYLVQFIGPGTWEVWGFSFCAFHILFAASFLMRLSSALFLIRRIKVPEHLSEVPAAPAGAPGAPADEQWEDRGDWTSLLRP